MKNNPNGKENSAMTSNREFLDINYKKYKNKMYSYCLYISGDKQLSEDVVHETFVRLSSVKEKTDTIASIENWLFICTRNLLFNNLNKMKKRISYDDLSKQITLDYDQKIFLEQILSQLDLDERELILLKEMQGYSIKEIASILEISEPSVRTRLFRVRKKMYDLGKGE